jgi:hypothetical protein
MRASRNAEQSTESGSDPLSQVGQTHDSRRNVPPTLVANTIFSRPTTQQVQIDWLRDVSAHQNVWSSPQVRLHQDS